MHHDSEEIYSARTATARSASFNSERWLEDIGVNGARWRSMVFGQKALGEILFDIPICGNRGGCAVARRRNRLGGRVLPDVTDGVETVARRLH